THEELLARCDLYRRIFTHYEPGSSGSDAKELQSGSNGSHPIQGQDQASSNGKHTNQEQKTQEAQWVS
ncbi:MAG TPA: hypothetical protein VFN23_07240, partial [Ktedonobacteraceae bacterium]|nr:hypothetical protein [Ktedonobacteraceae bacterium]